MTEPYEQKRPNIIQAALMRAYYDGKQMRSDGLPRAECEDRFRSDKLQAQCQKGWDEKDAEIKKERRRGK